MLTDCTCAPSDPCGYRFNGICDDACLNIGVNPFDDSADCSPPICGGDCSAHVLSVCTCAPEDPCGFRNDGICDDGCNTIAVNPFNDGADCAPPDIDGDGIADADELWFAETFAPALSFAVDEAFPDRYPSWLVEPVVSPGENRVSIFYAISYYDDGGEDASGTNGTYGDPEFVIVDVVEGPGGWDVVSVFLSAYYREPVGDTSGWYAANAFDYDTGGGGTHPIVYVASQDHAMFATLGDCDAGGWVPGLCDAAGSLELLEIDALGNAGNPTNTLFDAVELDFEGVTYEEFYFTEVRFCGWWIGPGEPRDECALDGYAGLIADWLNGL